MLEIKNLHAVVEEDGTEILKGVNLNINEGEIHAIMGPNGSGKSTLAKVVAGHEDYEVTEGDILFDGESILDFEPDERAHLGIFLAFQYPVEVPGVTNKTLLRESYNTIAEKRGREELDPLQFEDYAKERLEVVDMNPEFLERSINAGFSGGEKKRNEIFQMAVLDPRLSILDETDSGLDIDALKTVAKGINYLADDDNAVCLVTHYQRILDYVVPDTVHVMLDGKIVKSGDKDLAVKLEDEGYDWLTDLSSVSVNGEQN
ncbi:MAG TPA: Fe-S cluster assembly ATPase SufC [Balneolaceae bacterium]|nr:Fe-S cluster assembly ATPase SufC [Balneolaceae bacterium]